MRANSEKRSASDDSETFIEMDKYMKVRFKHVLNKEQGPNNMPPVQPNEILHSLYEIDKKKKQAVKIKEQMEQALAENARISMHDYHNLKQHLGLIKEDQENLVNSLPLSNFGPERVPQNIDSEVILGRAQRIMKVKNRSGQQQRAHALLKMFTVRGLPK